MKNATMLSFVGVLLLSFGASAADYRNLNVQPYQDKEWMAAKCRYLVLKEDGAYGNNQTLTLEGCVSNAEFGLMNMSNNAKTEAEEAAFHKPAEVEFIDDSGAKHTCTLDSKKQPYDHLPKLTLDEINRAGYFDQIPQSLKALFDENFSVVCKVEISSASPPEAIQRR